MHPFLQFLLGLAFAVLGAMHFLPATSGRFAEHYEKQWGSRGSLQHRVAGIMFLVLGLNFLAGAAGLPHFGGE